MTSLIQQLQSAVARVVEGNVPERILVVKGEFHSYDKHGSHDWEKILAFGSRHVVRRKIREVAKEHDTRVKSGSRGEMSFFTSWDDGCNSGGSAWVRIEQLSRKDFARLLLNPALSDMFKVVTDLTATEE
jgi:hypothetical protein